MWIASTYRGGNTLWLFLPCNVLVSIANSVVSGFTKYVRVTLLFRVILSSLAHFVDSYSILTRSTTLSSITNNDHLFFKPHPHLTPQSQSNFAEYAPAVPFVLICAHDLCPDPSFFGRTGNTIRLYSTDSPKIPKNVDQPPDALQISFSLLAGRVFFVFWGGGRI